MICSTIQSIDKALVARRFAHARNTYGRSSCAAAGGGENAAPAHETCLPVCCGTQRRGQYAKFVRQRLPFRHIVEFGCGTGCYSRLLLHALQPETLLLNDLCPEMRECICDLLPAGEPLPHKPLLYDDKVELYGAKVPLEKAKVPLYGNPLISPAVSFLPCDAETLDFPQGTDLITSCSTLQWFADTERFFTRCHHFLSDGGILAFSTFGKRNMQEIHTLTGHGLEYFSLEELKALLSSRFEVLYAEEEIVSLPFGTPLEVLQHLRQTGVTGTEKRVWTRGRLQSFCEEYIRMYGKDDRSVSLTYHPIYVIARKRGRTK